MKEKQLWDKVNFTWHPRSAWGEPEGPQTWNDPGFMETLEGFNPWDSREAGWLAWAGAGKATSWVWARLQEPCRAYVGACRGPQSRGVPVQGFGVPCSKGCGKVMANLRWQGHRGTRSWACAWAGLHQVSSHWCAPAQPLQETHSSPLQCPSSTLYWESSASCSL